MEPKPLKSDHHAIMTTLLLKIAEDLELTEIDDTTYKVSDIQGVVRDFPINKKEWEKVEELYEKISTHEDTTVFEKWGLLNEVWLPAAEGINLEPVNDKWVNNWGQVISERRKDECECPNCRPERFKDRDTHQIKRDLIKDQVLKQFTAEDPDNPIRKLKDYIEVVTKILHESRDKEDMITLLVMTVVTGKSISPATSKLLMLATDRPHMVWPTNIMEGVESYLFLNAITCIATAEDFAEHYDWLQSPIKEYQEGLKSFFISLGLNYDKIKNMTDQIKGISDKLGKMGPYPLSGMDLFEGL